MAIINRGTQVFKKLKLRDNKKLLFGDSDDVTMMWDSAYMRGPNPTSGFWSDLPSTAFADPSYCYQFFEDFTGAFCVGDETSTWTLDQLSGTVTLLDAGDATAAVGGGVISINTPTTALSGARAQIKVSNTDTDAGAFSIAAADGKRLWYEARVRLNQCSGQNVIFGLIDPKQTQAAANLSTTKLSGGIYFHQPGLSGALVNFNCATSGGTYSRAALASVSGGGWKTFGFKYDGSATVTAYVDGTASASTIPVGTASGAPTGYGLTPVFGMTFVSGADANTVYVDWVKVVKVR
jgi:hypothetical protein